MSDTCSIHCWQCWENFLHRVSKQGFCNNRISNIRWCKQNRVCLWLLIHCGYYYIAKHGCWFFTLLSISKKPLLVCGKVYEVDVVMSMVLVNDWSVIKIKLSHMFTFHCFNIPLSIIRVQWALELDDRRLTPYQ